MSTLNLHLTKYGQSSPLVFFHGWGFDSTIWHHLIPLLQNQYQLILVDLPGFGQSPMMDWNTFKKNLLTQLPPTFALVGWSMGGLYAMRLAIEAPEQVSALFNIATSPCFIAQDKSWPGVEKAVFTNFHLKLAQNLETTLKEFIALQANKVSIRTEHKASKEGLQTGLQILDTWDLREDIKQCNKPICFLFGRLDPITPVRLKEAMQEQYPQYQYLLFNKAAHMPFISHQELFIEALTGFIP